MQSLPEVLYTSAGERYLHLPGLILTNNGSQTRYLLGDGPSMPSRCYKILNTNAPPGKIKRLGRVEESRYTGNKRG